MGQVEVYEWLKEQRKTGRHNYFAVSEVKEQMKRSGLYTDNGRDSSEVKKCLVNLFFYGYVETQMTKDWRNWEMKFRLKEKYVNPHG